MAGVRAPTLSGCSWSDLFQHHVTRPCRYAIVSSMPVARHDCRAPRLRHAHTLKHACESPQPSATGSDVSKPDAFAYEYFQDSVPQIEEQGRGCLGSAPGPERVGAETCTAPHHPSRNLTTLCTSPHSRPPPSSCRLRCEREREHRCGRRPVQRARSSEPGA